MEILPDRVFNNFIKPKSGYKVMYSYNKIIHEELLCKGNAVTHKTDNKYTICISGLLPETGVECPMCSVPTIVKEHSYEVYFNGKHTFYLNKIKYSKRLKYNQFVNTICSLASTYKNPLIPSSYSNIEEFPSYVFPRLQNMCDRYYCIIDQLIKENTNG